MAEADNEKKMDQRSVKTRAKIISAFCAIQNDTPIEKISISQITAKAGDVVTIPAGVKHWHGATKNSWFSHLAVECPGEDRFNEWLEVVDDEQYNSIK